MSQQNTENKAETTVVRPRQGGWLRPWQKGQSGNPGGVGGPGSVYHEARKLCAEHTPEAIRKQIELMRTCDDPRVVTIVTQAIIDRGAGKPRDHSNEQTQRVDTSVLTPEKRELLAALLREAMGLQ